MKRDFVTSTFIIQDNKFLFVYHNKLKRWVPPGGHLDPNELPHEGAIREAFEETGLKVQLINLNQIDVHTPIARSLPQPLVIALEEVPECRDVPAHQHIDFIYVAEVLEGDLTENADETNGIKWLSLDEIYALAEREESFAETPKFAEYALQQLAVR